MWSDNEFCMRFLLREDNFRFKGVPSHYIKFAVMQKADFDVIRRAAPGITDGHPDAKLLFMRYIPRFQVRLQLSSSAQFAELRVHDLLPPLEKQFKCMPIW